MEALKALAETLGVDYVEQQGASNGWQWVKWHSGRYEAERVRTVGQITISNQLVAGVMASGAIAFGTTPHTLTAGSLGVVYLGNSSNSGCWCEMVGSTQYRLLKAIGSSVTLQGNIFKEMVVGGRWK